MVGTDWPSPIQLAKTVDAHSSQISSQCMSNARRRWTKNKMAPTVLPDSISKEERKAWERIIEKRRAEWAQLKPTVLDGIIRNQAKKATSPPPLDSSSEALEFILSKNFERSVNVRVAPSKRRAAWLLVKTLLEKSDRAWVDHQKNLQESAFLEISNASSNTQNQPLSNTKIVTTRSDSWRPTQFLANNLPTVINMPTDSNNTAKKAASSSQRASPPTTVLAGSSARQPSSMSNKDETMIRNYNFTSSPRTQYPSTEQSNQRKPAPVRTAAAIENSSTPTPALPVPPQENPRTNSQPQCVVKSSSAQLAVDQEHTSSPLETVQSKQSVSTSFQSTNATYHNPNATRTLDSYEMGALQCSGSSLSFDSNKNTCHQNISKPLPKNVVEKTPPRSPTPSRVCTPDLVAPPIQNLSCQPVTTFFPKDDNKYYGGLSARPIIKTVHRPQNMTEQDMTQINSRLATWDPYWKMEDILVLQQTCSVDFCDLKKDVETPVHQAVSCKFRMTPEQVAKVSGWGIPRTNKQYDHGECRLIIRMLPLEPERNKAESGKKARADFHIWPKGTLLSICGSAIPINQRKQQAHDKDYWQGLSYLLDISCYLTPALDLRRLLSVDACCFENKPYAICIAICKFQNPNILYRSLMDKYVYICSMKESVHSARQMTAQNMVILDQAHHEEEHRSFIFKLTCSMSSSLMHTPVRSTRCKHFQCFDLQNFLEVNQHISGTRWECPVCNNELVSVYDLELCALTKILLDQYKDVASAQRDRIEFYSDGIWKLLEEKKRRYGKSNSHDEDPGSMRANRPEVDEVIDLID